VTVERRVYGHLPTRRQLLARRLRQPQEAGVVDGGQLGLAADGRQLRASGVGGHGVDDLHQSGAPDRRVDAWAGAVSWTLEPTAGLGTTPGQGPRPAA